MSDSPDLARTIATLARVVADTSPWDHRARGGAPQRTEISIQPESGSLPATSIAASTSHSCFACLPR
jgi:hypothetical protein